MFAFPRDYVHDPDTIPTGLVEAIGKFPLHSVKVHLDLLDFNSVWTGSLRKTVHFEYVLLWKLILLENRLFRNRSHRKRITSKIAHFEIDQFEDNPL